MSSEFVRVEKESFIAEIILNNPPVNALNAKAVEEISSAAEEVSEFVKQREVRAVVFRSEGKHFCAGADLKERLSVKESDVAGTVKGIRRAVEAVWNIKVPVIALMHGAVLGGGMEIALAADIRLISEKTKMAMKEVVLGIIPGAGGTQRLSRIVGIGRALEWILTGKDISSEEALRAGLVTEVLPEKKLLQRGREIAKTIAENGPVSVISAKKAIRDGYDKPLEEALEIEWAEYLKTVPTKDRVEGLKSFMDKRKPEYNGY